MNRGLGRGVKPGKGSEIRRANDSKVQRFFFLFTISRITTVLAGRHSILSKKRKESRRWISTFCQNPGFCSYSGREEKNLLFGNGWKRIFHRWEERNKEIQLQNRPFRRRFRPIVCVSTYYRVYIRIYIWKIERHELSIGINTSMVDDFPRYTSNLESLSCSNTRSRLNFEEVKHVTECTLLFSPSDGEIAKVSIQVKFSRDSMVIETNGRADDVRKERNR